MQAKPYLKEILFKREEVPSFNIYPFNLPLVSNLSSIKFDADVTFIIGENGAGKSTLIEAIALSLGFTIEGGSKNTQFSTHSNASALYNYFKTIKSYSKPRDYFFLRAESFYNVATFLEDAYPDRDNFVKQYGVESLHECSHGESFLNLLSNRLRGKGLYIFDEPEAALSPNRQMSALSIIHQLVERHSQFIIATHSPILLSYPNATIYEIDQGELRRTRYEDTQHFKITRDFLNNYRRHIDHILAEEE
ncbi:AAA family ATPase [Desertivirga arenae]|uniref:AAA family ATPase n=1 Tax=Desertivirga arenae TaxID=2810309 RepID=UPI001A95EFCD|nr:AAA family ATPase [Pedobacter sp. SYSU D00823]